jgi:glycosyltransferase involved in cell wall biosynthesis
VDRLHGFLPAMPSVVRVRILIWHGYLLGGTGSNVYTRSLARAWSRLGHEVVVLCQEPHPEQFDLAGARVVRPKIDTRLPVFVLDRYPDLPACRLPEMGPTEVGRFVEANVAAVRAQGQADFLLANHVLLGGPVGAGSGLPFAVKAHGSELEFSMRGNAELCRWARESLATAHAVLAGSEHVARVLHDVVGPGEYTRRVHVLPPGVDVDMLRPQDRAAAVKALVEQCRLDAPNPPTAHDERRPDEGNAERLGRFLAGMQPTVLYVGKLSPEKGVSLLIGALAGVDARAVIVGFGPQRADLEAQVRELAPPARDGIVFTGPLEHRHLAHLWPLADVSVTPSMFPEAFGMVAAEAAACGSPPLVARHSGLAEVAAALEREYPARYRHLTGFTPGDQDELTAKLTELVLLPRGEWEQISAAARRAAVRQWSWEGIARSILDVMEAAARD